MILAKTLVNYLEIISLFDTQQLTLLKTGYLLGVFNLAKIDKKRELKANIDAFYERQTKAQQEYDLLKAKPIKPRGSIKKLQELRGESEKNSGAAIDLQSAYLDKFDERMGLIEKGLNNFIKSEMLPRNLRRVPKQQRWSRAVSRNLSSSDDEGMFASADGLDELYTNQHEIEKRPKPALKKANDVKVDSSGSSLEMSEDLLYSIKSSSSSSDESLHLGGVRDKDDYKADYDPNVPSVPPSPVNSRKDLNTKSDINTSHYLFDVKNTALLEVTVELEGYLIVLQKKELGRDPNSDSFYSQKSGEAKIKGITDLVSFLRGSECTLEKAKIHLEEILKAKETNPLLQNRGPIGLYYVGSFFKGEENPFFKDSKNSLDKKYVNSTVESLLVKLYHSLDKQVKKECEKIDAVQSALVAGVK